MQKEYIINNVHSIRKAKGLTQREVANGVGVSKQTIGALEKGNDIPSLILGIKIVRYLDSHIDEIFTYGYVRDE